MDKLPAIAPCGGENAGNERRGAGLIRHHRGEFLGTHLWVSTANSTGNVNSVPPPATEFTAPASTADKHRSTYCQAIVASVAIRADGFQGDYSPHVSSRRIRSGYTRCARRNS